MSGSADVRTWLARMEASRRETQQHLGVIERQIATRAQRMTITARVKRRRRRRNARAWTGVNERVYHDHLAALTLARLPEIEALCRRLARVDAALTRMRVQCRPHDPALS